MRSLLNNQQLEEMERSLEHEDANPVEAVKYYWQSWKYSQRAIQEAGK